MDNQNKEPRGPTMHVKVPETGQASLRITRGGRRKGAGRKSIGETRRMALTLPPEWWEKIDGIRDREGRSQADVIREMLHGVFSPLDYDVEQLKENDQRSK